MCAFKNHHSNIIIADRFVSNIRLDKIWNSFDSLFSFVPRNECERKKKILHKKAPLYTVYNTHIYPKKKLYFFLFCIFTLRPSCLLVFVLCNSCFAVCRKVCVICIGMLFLDSMIQLTFPTTIQYTIV